MNQERDRRALETLFLTTGGRTTWVRRNGWMSEAPVGEWDGVTTNREGRVTRIYLPRNGIRGALPSEIFWLARIEMMVLCQNRIEGEIPREMEELSCLKELDLSYNEITGEIPRSIGGMRKLREVNLSSNRLEGKIPPEIGRADGMESLVLDSNTLTGKIPEEIGYLVELERLDLRSNALTGRIPETFEMLTNLKYLGLKGNKFTGKLSAVVASRLKHHDLGTMSVERDDDRVSLEAEYKKKPGDPQTKKSIIHFINARDVLDKKVVGDLQEAEVMGEQSVIGKEIDQWGRATGLLITIPKSRVIRLRRQAEEMQQQQ